MNYYSLVSGILVLAMLTGGCAAMDEKAAEAREYRNAIYEEQFRYDRAQCIARGGRIIVDAIEKVDRDGIPKHRERYYCA